MSVDQIITAWGPAILGFAIMAAAINAVMTTYKKVVKDSAFENSVWYKRTLPLLPSLIGACTAPFVGPLLTPIELPILINVGAGVLQGSLGVHFYAMWKHAVERADEELQDTISNLGSEESRAGADDASV